MTKMFELGDETTTEAGRAAILDLYRLGKATGMIEPIEVRDLARKLRNERSISRDEADALFDLDASSCEKCAEWTEFLVEAVTDHVVWQARPTGILNSEQAEWLLAKADGSRSISALAVLVNVLAEADRVPVWFVAAVRGRVALGWPGVEEALAAANLARAA